MAKGERERPREPTGPKERSAVSNMAPGRRSTWRAAVLGPDQGKYGFRRWSVEVAAPSSGTLTLQARCTNANGEAQLTEPNWNPGGVTKPGNVM